MAQPQSSKQPSTVSRPSTFQHQVLLNNFGNAINQPASYVPEFHAHSRLEPSPKQFANSDAASSESPSVADSLRWGRRLKRSQAEHEKEIDLAVAGLKTARGLLDAKRLTWAQKQKIQDLTYPAERVIGDLRKEVEQLRKEIARRDEA